MEDPAAVALGLVAQLRQMDFTAWTEGTLTDRAFTLHRLTVLQAEARKITDALQEELAPAMTDDTVAIDGLGWLRREEVTREAWKDGGANERMRDDLARSVADSVSLDVATGELDPMKRNVAIAALRAAYDAIPSFSSLKVAGRRRFGLHLSDYRDYTTGYKVSVEAAE